MAAISALDEINLYDNVSEHFGSQNEDKLFFSNQTTFGKIKISQESVDYNSAEYSLGGNFGDAEIGNFGEAKPNKFEDAETGEFEGAETEEFEDAETGEFQDARTGNFGNEQNGVNRNLKIGQKPDEVIAPPHFFSNHENYTSYPAYSNTHLNSFPQPHSNFQPFSGARHYPSPQFQSTRNCLNSTENLPARKRANRNRNRNRNQQNKYAMRSQQIVRIAGALHSVLHGDTIGIGAQLRNYMMNENFGPDSLAHTALKLRYAMDEILFLPDVARYFNERR